MQTDSYARTHFHAQDIRNSFHWHAGADISAFSAHNAFNPDLWREDSLAQGRMPLDASEDLMKMRFSRRASTSSSLDYNVVCFADSWISADPVLNSVLAVSTRVLRRGITRYSGSYLRAPSETIWQNDTVHMACIPFAHRLKILFWPLDT